MNWIPLDRIEQLEEIRKSNEYSIIFKHSTRCSISLMARKKFELEWDSLPAGIPVYFLDLLSHRNISNSISEIFHVHHESPQLLLIKNGECIYDASHGEISADETAEQMTVDSNS